MNIDRQTFRQLVDMLTPYVRTEGVREAFLDTAFYGTPLVHTDISGDARTFASRIVNAASNFGEINGEHTIFLLLHEIREHVGTDNQRKIDTLVQILENSPNPTEEISRWQAQITQITRLRWYNPWYWMLLFWWLFYDPAKIKAHDEAYGKQAKDGVGNWLINTVAWMPLFIISCVMALRPALVAIWAAPIELDMNGISFPLAILVPASLLTAIASAIPNESQLSPIFMIVSLPIVLVFAMVNIMTIIVGVVMVVGVWVGLEIVIVVGLTVVFSFIMLSVIGSIVTFGRANTLGWIVTVGVMFGVMISGAIVATLGGTIFVVVGTGFIVTGGLIIIATGIIGVVTARTTEEAVKNGKTLPLYVRFLPPTLLIVYVTVAWVFFTAPVITP